jgi:hypothetical protein
MPCCLVAVRTHPGDFSFEQGDPFAKLVVRIPVERLRCQLAGQIACAAWALIKFHQCSLCDRLSLAVNLLHGYLAPGLFAIFRCTHIWPDRFKGAWYEAVTSDNDRNGV